MGLEARIGTVLRGKWTLERLLGSGGMAAVYVGLHRIGRRDAIKILHPQITSEAQLRARFNQEAYAVNHFVHPGAVEIRDIDETEDGCPFLVMELLEGESLRARCDRQGAPDIAETLRIADEVLDVLAAAHSQGIIHRDIKPDNLFYLPDGRIKVLDFGVARVRQAANELRTHAGTTLGTVSYMPPEQVKGMDVDARVDVFAVAATMFRLIANRRIHEARSDSELLVKMATEPAPPLASVVPGVPPGVSAVVDRGLCFDREGRYPSARAMQDDIRAIRNGQAPLARLAATNATFATSREGEPNRDRDGKQVSATALTVALGSAKASEIPSREAAQLDSARAQPAFAEPVDDSKSGEPPKQRKLAALVAARLIGLRRRARAATRGRKVLWLAGIVALMAVGTIAFVLYGGARGGREAGSGSDADETAQSETARSPNSARPKTSSQLDCFSNNACDQVCEHKCRIQCDNRAGCTVGALHGAKVHCVGPEPCAISCAGSCKVKSEHGGPFLVRCAPSFDCEIEDCPVRVERCSSTVFACGAPCPG